MEAIGYIRKSKRDQSHYSLEYQEQSIREYCQRNSVDLRALFIDDGESSYTFDRPDYKALEKFIREHKKSVRYLVVLDHDRFSRNLPEALLKIEELEKKYGLKVLATNESLDIDTSDPMVFMQRAFKYLVANQELFTIRKRAKMGLRQAQMSGRYVNLAPFGYINEKTSDGKGVIQIDESKAFVVQKIFRDYLAGVPVYLIYKDVVKLGFPQKGHSAIPRILRNPLYAGLVRVTATDKEAERFVKGLHQPIISEDQFWRAYEMINTKRSMKVQPKDEFPLKGILRSPCCGGPMTAGWTKGKLKYYLYYRCIKHSNINISGKVAHDKFERVLQYLSFSQRQIDDIIIAVRSALKGSAHIKAKQLAVVEDALRKSERQLERVEQKFVDDEINSDTYNKWTRKLKVEIARSKEEIKTLKADKEEVIEAQLSLLPNLLNLRNLFEKATISQQHAIIRQVFKHNLTFVNGTFRTPEINPAFSHNLLKLKDERLLEVEQSSEVLKRIPSCGERGIRTPGPLTVNGFQDRRNRPLCHLSGRKSIKGI